MQDFIEIIKFVILSIVAIASLTTLLLLLLSVPDRAACRSYGKITGLETNYAWLSCYAKDENYGWMTLEERKNTRYGQRINEELN